MYEVIASPFLDDYVVVRPGSQQAVKIGAQRYRHLLATAAVPGASSPQWLVDAVRARWDLDLCDRELRNMVMVREPSPLGYGRASYELNLGCNYDCEHCYLGLKQFKGMTWDDRERVLRTMRDAGVLWVQLTGGEPTIDPLFTEVYMLGWDLGMMITVLSNGSRLHNTRILDVLVAPPVPDHAERVRRHRGVLRQANSTPGRVPVVHEGPGRGD
jgi:hypothetical protein